MTASRVVRRLPENATVMEVDGSRFLLEWLDLGALAAAVAMSSAGAGGLKGHAAGSGSADR